MNFKNITDKTNTFIRNFKNPIMGVGCVVVIASIIFTVCAVTGRIENEEMSTMDSECSTVDECVLTEEDSSATEEESVTIEESTTSHSTPEEVTTKKMTDTTSTTRATTTVVSTTNAETEKETEKPTEKETVKETAASTTSNNAQSSDWLNGYTWEEYDLLARTIYQEAGICGEYCQWLVGSTVLNLADERGGIKSVVTDYNTFNVAYKLFRETPSNLSYSVAKRLISGDRNYKVKAFRTDYYHNFGTPYTSVDNVYFSTY